MSNKYKIVRFLPSLIWMMVIFYFSAQQTTGIQGTFNQRFIILKSFHLIEYAILCALLYVGFKNYKSSVLISYFYALSDELHQSYVPGREGKLIDTFIDLFGISIGVILIRHLIPLIVKFIRK
ncbi:MAG: VanZ family protein [Candidatus Shapirobacteria bacterium]